jgi:hypothetical protein
MAYSGTIAIWAKRDGQFTPKNFPGTRLGFQEACDYLLGGRGKVFIGPGVLETDTAVWIHSGVHLQGCGINQTIIRRTTMADGDAANSAAVIAVSAYGFNGTIPTSGTPQSDITISDLTLDGNYSLFGAVTQANLIPAGIHANFTDGVRITRVRTVNCLGDGFRLRFCRNAYLTDVEAVSCGKWSISAAKNGINFIGDYAGVGAWGYNHSLIGARISDIGTGAAAKDAEAIQVSAIHQLTIDNVEVDGCDYVIECAPTVITVGTWGKWTIKNVIATNVKGYFFVFGLGQSSGYTLEDVVIDGCEMAGHATLHDGGVISLTSASSAVAINRFRMNECHYRNVNTFDTTTRNWFDIQPANAAGYRDISLSHITAQGLPGSTRTGSEIGIVLRAPLANVRLHDVHLRDVPGRGIHISDNANMAAPVIDDVVLSDVFVEGSNDVGFRVGSFAATGTGTIGNVRFIDCVAKDTSKVTTVAGFQINMTQAGATTRRIYFDGCRAYRTAGVTMNFGLTLLRSAGTVDEIHIQGCDFQVAANSDGIFFDAGATNVRLIPRPGQGPNITAAATIQIPVDGDVFLVTGNTNITNGITVRVWDKGRTVRLIFTGTPTVSDTGTSRLLAALVAAADTTLQLCSDGTNWYELSRSIN